MVRVQRCGKSAPAGSGDSGSVNPSWKQGERENEFLALVIIFPLPAIINLNAGLCRKRYLATDIPDR
jgi:hypothetical protein